MCVCVCVFLVQVNAVRVDDVQGKEYRALLVSTVRTCATVPSTEEPEEGFLSNLKVHEMHL